MTRQTRTEIEESLLSGKAVAWNDGQKRETLQLNTATQRRLFRYVLGSNVRLVKGLTADFVEGLSAAFVEEIDPATQVGAKDESLKVLGPWRLSKIETNGFGGINTWGGPPFMYYLDGASLIIDGPNGSGKSSFVGALTWAMSGERARESGGPLAAHDSSLVYNAKGDKVGDWPPLACYPQKASQLGQNPAVSVALTFSNASEQEGKIERSLANGRITFSADPALKFPPVLVEAGLMMPARLTQIRLGAGDHRLTDAVQMLTGLDEIADLGDFVGDLCHKGRDFLKYAVNQRREDFQRQFDEGLNKAEKALLSLEQKLHRFGPRDTRELDGKMASLCQTLKSKAAETVEVISADLLPTLDLQSVTVQQQIATAIAGAKFEISEGLDGISIWRVLVAISTALDGDAAKALQAAVSIAKEKHEEANCLDIKAAGDEKFRLKALAAAYHQEHVRGDVDMCPLCDQSLKDLPELSSELADLKVLGAAATKTHKDNLNSIYAELQNAIPTTIRRFSEDILGMQPKQDLEKEISARFVHGSKYSQCLTGLAQVVGDALNQIPVSSLQDYSDSENLLKGGTEDLSLLLTVSEKMLAIQVWMTANRSLWQTWWDDLTEKTEAEESAQLAKKIDQLEVAIRAWAPYADAAHGIDQAWAVGLLIDKIDIEQERRQEIADNLDCLKALRKLAEAETRNAIEGLSSRMASFLEDIYVGEKLKFHSTHFDKKAGVSVRGGFDSELRIDATLVANTSWIRVNRPVF